MSERFCAGRKQKENVSIYWFLAQRSYSEKRHNRSTGFFMPLRLVHKPPIGNTGSDLLKISPDGQYTIEPESPHADVLVIKNPPF